MLQARRVNYVADGLYHMYRHTLVGAQLPQLEYLALYDFYNATNGKDWTWFTHSGTGNPWSFASYQNPCTSHWQGVSCIQTSAPATYHVSTLELNSHNLRGRLPSSMGNLSKLAFLVWFSISLFSYVIMFINAT